MINCDGKLNKQPIVHKTHAVLLGVVTPIFYQDKVTCLVSHFAKAPLCAREPQRRLVFGGCRLIANKK